MSLVCATMLTTRDRQWCGHVLHSPEVTHPGCRGSGVGHRSLRSGSPLAADVARAVTSWRAVADVGGHRVTSNRLKVARPSRRVPGGHTRVATGTPSVHRGMSSAACVGLVAR